eukprot:1594358-Rhodomonas_salina.1
MWTRSLTLKLPSRDPGSGLSAGCPVPSCRLRTTAASARVSCSARLTWTPSILSAALSCAMSVSSLTVATPTVSVAAIGESSSLAAASCVGSPRSSWTAVSSTMKSSRFSGPVPSASKVLTWMRPSCKTCALDHPRRSAQRLAEQAAVPSIKCTRRTDPENIEHGRSKGVGSAPRCRFLQALGWSELGCRR